MTTEEKAKEITETMSEHGFDMQIYDAVIQMAKWKDEQYEKEIRKQLQTLSEECKQKAIAFIQSNYGTKD